MSEQLKAVASSLGLDSVLLPSRFGQRPPAAQLEPLVFGQGVTGANSSIPVFDGTSLDPHDFLIDLESDSMERHPDIRSYFHLVGEFSQNPTPPPSDPLARTSYDDNLVRLGRLYLKAAKARGHGLYLSKERDFMALNVPGGRWYRMPTAGIVEKFLERDLQPLEEEGGFTQDPSRIRGVHRTNEVRGQWGRVILTNIRSTIWWGDSLRPGIVPGTKGYHDAIFGLYWSLGHPSSVMWARNGGRSSIIDHFGIPAANLFQIEKATAIVDSEWHRSEDEDDGGQDSEDSQDEAESTPNRLVFDPAFLADIA